jgi:hypothetical protein
MGALEDEDDLFIARAIVAGFMMEHTGAIYRLAGEATQAG